MIYREALEEAFSVMNEIYSELGLNPKDLVHDGGIIPNPPLFQSYIDGVLRLYISQKISNERNQTRDMKKDSKSDSKPTEKMIRYIKDMIGQASKLELTDEIITIFKDVTGTTSVKTENLNYEQADKIIKKLRKLLR